jgi:nitrate/nitrite-specific signal transduction histidine kinase
MRRRNVNVLLLLFLPLAVVSVLDAGTIATPAEAVNIAGKQRMYTMRMLRDYIMIGEKLQYKNPSEDLKQTVARYTHAQESLVGYVTHPTFKDEIEKIDAQWAKIKKMMKAPPKKELMADYAKNAIDFREMLNAFVNHLAKASGKQSAQAVNLAGRLRAVSQALAAVYQLKAWGMPQADEKMQIPMKRFRASLDYLASAKETQDPMRKKLVLLEKIYRFFEVMNDAGTLTPTLVIKKTDTMLQLSDELTRLYVEVGAPQGDRR